MAEEKYNRKNPAVKRILQELKEMQANPSDDFMSLPLEENIFEWQFAIRGPKDTEFEGGIFHGRIQLPSEYPFKPPSFLLLTPNGRFETQTKICLSISNYHPEHWQPSWSVRTALVALIAFMPTSPNGALGSLEYTKEERRVLAIKSREAAPIFGNPDRQQLINEIHEYMLSKSPSLPRENSSDESAVQVREAERTTEIVDANDTEQNLPDSDSTSTIVEEHQDESSPPITNPVQMSSPDAATTTVQTSPPAVQPSVQQLPRRTEAPPRHADDRLFTMAAVGLTIAIVVLLLKKFMRANGYGAMFTDES